MKHSSLTSHLIAQENNPATASSKSTAELLLPTSFGESFSHRSQQERASTAALDAGTIESDKTIAQVASTSEGAITDFGNEV